MFEYCDIKSWLFIPCEKEMHVKCCQLKLKYQISHSDLHNTMFKHDWWYCLWIWKQLVQMLNYLYAHYLVYYKLCLCLLLLSNFKVFKQYKLLISQLHMLQTVTLLHLWVKRLSIDTVGEGRSILIVNIALKCSTSWIKCVYKPPWLWQRQFDNCLCYIRW